MRVAAIRNPVSGRGRGGLAWPKLQQQLQQTLGSRLELIEETTASGSAKAQAALLAQRGFDIVVAGGGDGTVSQVMQGLLGTNSALAVLPLGTGNDFARTLGFGPSTDLAIQALKNGKIENVDVGAWRQEGRCGHFLNVAGCGFDAAVADRINRGIRNLHGQAAYLAGVLQCLRTYRPTKMTITIDGERIEEKAMLCAIANAKCYGGGMKIAPHAEIQDGLLDLVLVGDFKPLPFLLAFPKVLKGTHLQHAKVQHRTFRKLEIESDPPAPFLIDGELLPPGKVTVDVMPKALRVVTV